MSTLAIKNIGKLITGDLNNPVSEHDTIIVVNGKIKEIGGTELLNNYDLDKVVDAKGTTVAPGLIDSHAHPVLGDFTPRQKTMGFIESSLHGGVSTMISAGEPHTPGRPKGDKEGAKSLAKLVHKSFNNLRPGGVKVHGGALILEKGLTEEDFKEVTREGVWLVGEVGLGTVKDPEEAAPMIEMAKNYGMKVMMHTGGTSIPGSSNVGYEDVINAKPTVVSHLNGGPTSIPFDDVKKLIDNSDITLELVHNGNPKIMKQAAEYAMEKDCLDRFIIGNDAPSGTGVIVLSIIRVISFLSSVAGIPPEKAICMATGNTSKVYDLNVGLIEKGREADFVIMDAPMGSVGEDSLTAFQEGDLPGVSMVIVDGEVMFTKSRNTPPAVRMAEVQ
ncbi:amidohydrolase family protein [Natranaerobius thermophilus]|uniref:Amidohydrolase n=1 Tax=Natranaerobius thermophilus (strain ATCC BAA-1301 / DSM 18059 / JW/NM-WN-LF) TaxID=457570 RepID=B2A7K1_NATTJ|nr:amidohydrolase family protein [Natranaerobius thermophilus]ACB85710.1 amidohydrolase [Natranaerobius thermophilus JW/NM-WN-LF]